MLNRLLIVLGLSCFCLWSAPAAFSQARLYHRLDTLTLSNVSQFSCADLIWTGLPGREYAVSGTVTGADTTGRYRQSVFILNLDTLGRVFRYDEFEDQAVFLFQGPKAYSLCYDGLDAFYIGLGSNNRQLVIKADTTGQLDWALAQHHHEFYSLLCDGAGVTFLGQDESQQGAHDFSISHFTPSGGDGVGAMYGTTGFEVPEKMLRCANGGFLMAGQTSLLNTFMPMLLRVDANYDLVWGYMYNIPQKRGLWKDAAPAHDGSGYLMTGFVQGLVGGTEDSLLLSKVDTAGNLLWSKIYGGPAGMELQGFQLEVQPDGGIYLGVTARDTGYRYPVLLRTDADGNVLAARSFDDADANTEEAVTGMHYNAARQRLYVTGDRTTVTPTFQLIKEVMVMHVAEDLRVGCDTPIVIGSRNVAMTDSSGWLYEPYQVIDTTMIFAAFPGTVLTDTQCTHQYVVGIAAGAQPAYTLAYANPASSQWQVTHTLPLGGATLEWIDLQGRVLLRRALPAGYGRTDIDLDDFADGLYLMRLRGQDWASETKRVLLVRN